MFLPPGTTGIGSAPQTGRSRAVVFGGLTDFKENGGVQAEKDPPVGSLTV